MLDIDHYLGSDLEDIMLVELLNRDDVSSFFIFSEELLLSKDGATSLFVFTEEEIPNKDDADSFFFYYLSLPL